MSPVIDLLNDPRVPEWLKGRMRMVSAEAEALSREGTGSSVKRIEELQEQAIQLAHVAEPYLAQDLPENGFDPLLEAERLAQAEKFVKAEETAEQWLPGRPMELSSAQSLPRHAVMAPASSPGQRQARVITLVFPNATWIISAAITILITSMLGGAIGAFMVKRK